MHTINKVYFDGETYHYTCSCGEVVNTPCGHIAVEVKV